MKLVRLKDIKLVKKLILFPYNHNKLLKSKIKWYNLVTQN